MACRDRDWVQLLEWEALQWGEKKVIDEERRQVQGRHLMGEKTERVEDRLADFTRDKRVLLLSMMALTAYPLAFPQLARLATGLSVSDEQFQKQREGFLKQIALLLRGKKPGLDIA